MILKSILYFLFSISLATISNAFAATGSACHGFYEPSKDVRIVEIDLDDPALSVALKPLGILRPGLFSSRERNFFDLHGKKINITAGPAPVSKIEPGVLFQPQQRGVVVEDAGLVISSEKTAGLRRRLNGDGNLALFADQRDRNIFVSAGVPIAYESTSPFYRVDDAVFLSRFMSVVSRKTHLPDEHLNYLQSLYEAMIRSARMVSNDGNRKITGIRMRFKHSGRGKDVDLAHVDPAALFATTLAIDGIGTEYMFVDGNKVEIRIAGKNQISHLIGELSESPVWHRASTFDGSRIIFIIFWD